MPSPSDSLAAIQALAVRFRDDRDWSQFHTPKDLALGLTVEAGELAELFLWKTKEQTAAALEDEAFRRRLGEELADVQIFLCYLAEAARLDLAAATRAKIAANGAKYPIEKSRGRAAKYNEL
jgi:NTP pyrophosphatase (non-canonical NTP hydrolase)